MSGPSSCSRCGGSLPSPDDLGNIICPTCGLFHHVGDDDQAAPPTGVPSGGATPSPPIPPAPGPSSGAGGPFGSGGSTGGGGAVPRGGDGPRRPSVRRGPGAALGCLLPLIILAAVLVPVAIGVVAIVRAVSDAVDSAGADVDLTVTTGDGEVVTDGEGQPTEIVAMAQPAGSTTRVIARASLDGEVAWQAPVVPADVYSAQVRVTDDLVLASLGDEVVALDGATGEERWRVTVSDEVAPRCRDCFAVVDGTLVVLGRDAHITAIGLDGGETLWTRRLESPSATVHVVGETLLVLDDPADATTEPGLVITDPATGEERDRITPSCPDLAYGPESDVPLDFRPDSLVLPVPDSDDIVLVFGSSSACVQRWTVTGAEMRWSRPAELGASFFDPVVIADATDMIVADDSTSVLVHIGLSEGTIEALPLPQDTSPSEVGVLRDGRLVTAVQSSRGSTRWSLLAIDLRRKETVWERTLPRGVEPFDLAPDRSSDTLFEGDARFLLAAADDGEVALVTMASPGQRLTVESVDGATGQGRQVGRSTFAVRYAGSSSPSARIEAVTGGQVVFTTESIPQVLDLATGAITASWAGG